MAITRGTAPASPYRQSNCALTSFSKSSNVAFWF